VNERDDDIIDKYSPCKERAAFVRGIAEKHGGVDRVENGKFIFADGFKMYTESKTMLERWAEEDAVLDAMLPADYLQVHD
jgi:hypothetical protein